MKITVPIFGAHAQMLDVVNNVIFNRCCAKTIDLSVEEVMDEYCLKNLGN